jgi:hypothetical protein
MSPSPSPIANVGQQRNSSGTDISMIGSDNEKAGTTRSRGHTHVIFVANHFRIRTDSQRRTKLDPFFIVRLPGHITTASIGVLLRVYILSALPEVSGVLSVQTLVLAAVLAEHRPLAPPLVT